MPRSAPDAAARAARARTALRRARRRARRHWFWLRERDDPDVLALPRSRERVHRGRRSRRPRPLRERLFDGDRRPRPGDRRVARRCAAAGTSTSPAPSRACSTACTADARSARPAARSVRRARQHDRARSSCSTRTRSPTGHDYFALGGLAVEPRPDASLAYSVDTTGGERYDAALPRPRRRGDDLDDVVADVYYGARVGQRRPHRLLRPARRRDAAVAGVAPHARHAGRATTCSCSRRTTSASTSASRRTRSGRFVVIDARVEGHERGVARRRRRRRPPTPRVVEPRVQGHEYHVEHHERAEPATASSSSPTPTAPRTSSSWSTPVPTPGRASTGRACSRTATTSASTTSTRSPATSCVSERADGLERLRVLAPRRRRRRRRRPRARDAASPCTRRGSAPTPSSTRTTLRYGYTSLVAPASTYDYDLDDARRHAREAPAGARATTPTQYDVGAALGDRARRHPRPDLDRPPPRPSRSTAPRPLLLYGYGSYEASIDPTFSASRVSLLDRGVVFAIAHVRGGGELGRRWYEDGKLDAQAQHVHRLRRVRRAPRAPRAGRRPTGSPRAAAAPAGCSWARSRTCAPTCSAAIVAEVPFVDVRHDDARRDAPAHDHRVGGVGRPGHDPDGLRAT